MATKRGRKSKAETSKNTLLEALRFVGMAQSEIGSVSQTHCRMSAGWIAASNGVMTIGARIEDALEACPHTRRLSAALERSGEGIALTQLDAGRLAVKSGALRAVVPCVDPGDVSLVWATPNIAPLDDKFAAGCRAIEHIASEGGQSVECCSLLVSGKTLCATNRQVIAEYWHGNDLPPYFVIPKVAANAIGKCGKKLTGFGYDGRSATFYFDDESWLKTQLFEDKWPNVQSVFDKEKSGSNAPIPIGFFEALASIGDFSDCGQVAFKNDLLATVNTNSQSAEHDVKGLVEGPRFSIKNLELIAPIAKTLNVDMACPAAYFYGDSVRGAISFYRTQDNLG